MNSTPLIAGNCSGGRIFKSWGIFRDGKRIATMEPDALSPEQEHALALNFSAAPELLAALQGLMEWESIMGGWEGTAWTKARAAIAKATGN